MKEKEYKITFSTDYSEYENREDSFWTNIVGQNPYQLAICKKYRGKTISLNQIPKFVKEVGECIIKEDEIEVYNDYRE